MSGDVIKQHTSAWAFTTSSYESLGGWEGKQHGPVALGLNPFNKTAVVLNRACTEHVKKKNSTMAQA